MYTYHRTSCTAQQVKRLNSTNHYRHGTNTYVRTTKHHHSTAHSATVIHVPFSLLTILVDVISTSVQSGFSGAAVVVVVVVVVVFRFRRVPFFSYATRFGSGTQHSPRSTHLHLQTHVTNTQTRVLGLAST